jgi:hypothetical protein
LKYGKTANAITAVNLYSKNNENFISNLINNAPKVSLDPISLFSGLKRFNQIFDNFFGISIKTTMFEKIFSSSLKLGFNAQNLQFFTHFLITPGRVNIFSIRK